jgi:hypothetical protein
MSSQYRRVVGGFLPSEFPINSSVRIWTDIESTAKCTRRIFVYVTANFFYRPAVAVDICRNLCTCSGHDYLLLFVASRYKKIKKIKNKFIVI